MPFLASKLHPFKANFSVFLSKWSSLRAENTLSSSQVHIEFVFPLTKDDFVFL